MRKAFFCILSLSILVGSFTSCNDDDESKIEQISIFQAEYDYDEKAMVLRIKDNETLQLIPLIFPATVENKTLTYQNENTSLMEVSSEGVITGKAIGVDKLTVRATDGSGVSQTYKVFILDHKIKATKISVIEAFKEITISEGDNYNLAPGVVFEPDATWDKSVAYSSSDNNVATVNEEGIITGVSAGVATITVTTKDGTNLSDNCTVTVVEKLEGPIDIIRTLWTVTPSHKLPKDDAISNSPESLIDGSNTTCMSMVKPGKSYDGITVPETEEVSFVVDMGKEETFNYFRLRHRNSTLLLRVYGLSVYGSNDNKTFTAIKTNISIPNVDDGSVMESGNVDLPLSTYRYVKVVYTEWNSGGNTMQIAEFNIGRLYE